MYNIRSANGNQCSKKNIENVCQQQQPNQITSNVSACETSPKPIGQEQNIEHSNHQPVESISMNNTQNSTLTPVNESLENETSIQNNKNDIVNSADVHSIQEPNTKKSEVKWPTKRKINKKDQKKRLNARIRRLVCPKSPLMVFSELYKDIPIILKEESQNNFLIYKASIEVDGQVYEGGHISKTQAKQKACENFLRVIFEKKIREQPPEKKTENFAKTEMEAISENGTTAKSNKGPPMEDFPWQHFVSLAMHNLICHWDLQPVTTKVVQKETHPKVVKVGGMKKFPDHPENYNPVQLLHQLTPGILFREKIVTSKNPSVFEVSCEIENIKFSGQGTTKKGAKRECAIKIIKHFWNFDFNTIPKNG